MRIERVISSRVINTFDEGDDAVTIIEIRCTTNKGVQQFTIECTQQDRDIKAGIFKVFAFDCPNDKLLEKT